ncbi:M56 family metallopeptidase [Chengkuizengella sediminis]|uniref:M56 family metallopeptidase n=1 Tax=Chengkuizengella sediminis TaxID=1885917 RepID=UPI00138A36E5|nr:M56 family metallopeptidase [Chengkuizengella sediminis]NDI36084.1 M48 family metalloprotease [Chengkuizengella sediminis]
MDVQNLFSIVLNFSLIGGIIAVLILFIKRVLNDKLSAHWHYYIWLILIIRLLIPFSFESSLSLVQYFPTFSEFKINEPIETPVRNQTTSPPLNMENIKGKNENITINEMNEPPVAIQTMTNLTLTNFNKEIMEVGEKDSISESVAVKQIKFNIFNLSSLGMLWLFGVLMVFIFFLIENIDYNWRLSKQPKCKDVDILSLLEACKKKLKVSSNIQIINDDKIDSPSIIGFLVPKIVISKPLLESLSKNEKKYVLLHELTHFKKKDVLIQWMSIIVLAIHWFNPIIWYSFYQLRKDCELSCDASVLSQLKKDEHLAYGNTLLSVLGKVSKPTFIPSSIGMSAGLSDMKSRMKRINMFKKQSRKWIMLSIMITASIILVGFTVFDLNNNGQDASQSVVGNIQSDHETEESNPENLTIDTIGTWTEVSSMNQAGYPDNASVVIDGNIYIVGGSVIKDGVYVYSSSLEVYHPQTDTWTQLASMNQARNNHTTEVIDGKIYVVGGYGYDGEDYRYLSDVEVYDPQSDTWRQLTSMDQARGNHSAEVIDGKIYIVGGDGNQVDYSVLSSVEVYDLQTDTWTQLTSMNEARFRFATEVIDGKIYTIGGRGDYTLSSTEVYDPETDTWTLLANMNKPREDFSIGVIDEKLYVVGGFNGNFMRYRKENYLSSVEVYDPQTDTWTQLTSMNQPRDNHATEVIDEKIYAIGGYYDYNHLSNVEVYDPETDKWTEVTNMNHARYGQATELIDDKLYVLGGYTQEQYGSRSVEVYDFMK